jgi:tRNA threonylcarbamoyladenosine biosynthesis protein TsaB
LSIILNIETSTTNCSVSISKDREILHSIELNDGYKHAENLHPFIEEAITKAAISINDISAVSVGKGPGSYTGLRIGVSAAKGLAYALNIPLIGINSLKVLANTAIDEKKEPEALYVPMIDARRMEVYTSCFDSLLNELKPTEALILNEENPYEKEKKIIYIFGDGAHKIKDVWNLTNIRLLADIYPNAISMATISHDYYDKQQFENVAYFEPFYLKEFVGIKK